MELLVGIFIIHRIRASLAEGPDRERWYKVLTYGMVAAGVLFVMKSGSSGGRVIELLGYCLLLALCYGIYKVPAFSSARYLMISILPLVIVAFADTFIQLILPSFHDSIETYFDIFQGFGVVWLIGSFILYRRQQKALDAERKLREQAAAENRMNAARKAELELVVNERTRELSEQNEKLQQTLHDLNAAQAQLIHAEKMASLGQLMAGIAHEIKNPLNFVNNFSDLNAELTGELIQALEQGNQAEALQLAGAIRENEEKIVHHGKRADSIVRSMLQHSRSGTGKREWVDINQMAEECVRLSFHGMRAREKSFNAKVETQFDNTAGNVEVVPEEINRVLLNICTNAFYAVHERAKTAENGYQPVVEVSTRGEAGRLAIVIKDNGTGIPAEAMDKIFQPFFTTKPTGEGTGLGLSMSYDIITKGHQGEIKVQSTEGEGTEFTILLPQINQVSLTR